MSINFHYLRPLDSNYFSEPYCLLRLATSNVKKVENVGTIAGDCIGSVDSSSGYYLNVLFCYLRNEASPKK